MPDAQSEIEFAFEVLHDTLDEFAQVDTAQNADLIDAFESVLYGTKQTEVEALLSGPTGRPMIPVTNRGVPSLVDCWSRVLAAINAYNALGSGLQLVASSQDPQAPPTPHCVKIVVDESGVRVVYNYELSLTLAGRTEPVYRLSAQAGVARQVLAMGHAAVRVPIVPVSP